MVVKKALIHQSIFAQAPELFPEIMYFFLIGGYACGKTSALSDAIFESIVELAGKKDKEGRKPKIGVCGITLTFLKKTLSGVLTQVLDMTKSTYTYDKNSNILTVAGVEIHLTPIINEEDIFGFDWNRAFVDELDELPTYKAVAVVKTISERCRQTIDGVRTPFLSFATTSQGLKGTFQTIETFRKQGVPYFIVRGKTVDNIHLPKSYIENQYKIMSEKEAECFLEGKFVSVNTDKTYPSYDRQNHYLDYDVYDTINADDIIYIGQDFNTGFNKAAAVVCREGIAYIVKNYVFPDVRKAPEVFRYDFPKNKIRWIPDSTSNDMLPQFRKAMRENSIEVVYRKKNPLVRDRTFLINSMFHADRLFVGKRCEDVDEALFTRQNDPVTGLPMKGKGEKAPDHICDCVEYALYYCVSWLSMFKDLYSVTLGRKLKNLVDAGLRSTKDAYMHIKESKASGQ